VQALVDQFDAAFQAAPRQRFIERRHLEITGLFGAMHIFRDYYSDGQRGHCPADAALALEGAYTPALSRMIYRAAAKNSYQEASQDLFEYAGVKVCDRQIQRRIGEIAPELTAWLKTHQSPSQSALMYICADGTGLPMRPEELAGRKGKQADGSAKTREAKLGCVFTQIGLDREGYPQRDPHSTTYVGAIESSTLFGWRIYAEALRRGLEQAKTVVVLTDGARYNHTIIQTHFPQAVHIVDLFHAYEHLTALAQILWGQEAKAPKAWRERLEAGDIGRLVRQVGKQLPASAPSKKSMLKQLRYFENNAPQMRYAEYRERKFFVGSGVVEAGCRTVIGQRLKQSGMRWSVDGANAIMALRCCILSDRFEDFWASRTS